LVDITNVAKEKAPYGITDRAADYDSDMLKKHEASQPTYLTRFSNLFFE